MCQTIIGRVGSSVLLFQVAPAAAMPPYKPLGAVYSLSNLLCFIQTAPKAVAVAVSKGTVATVLSNLVTQAKLVQTINEEDFLLPSIFQIVDHSWFELSTTLVDTIKTKSFFSQQPNDKGVFFRMNSHSSQCCIGKGTIQPATNTFSFEYAVHISDLAASSEKFDQLFPLVKRYLQL